jgi:hypothetical protein
MESPGEASSPESATPSSRRLPFPGPNRVRGRVYAATIGAGVGLAVFQAQLLVSGLTTEVFRNDFRLYVGAARLGLARGFGHLYDLDLQRQAVEALFPRANFQPFVSPPLDAWLAAPLAGLPFFVGLVVWTAILVVCALLTWLLLARGGTADRLAQLLFAAGFLPLCFAISVGQLAPVIGLAIAVGYRLLRSGRPELAGIALVAVWLKPQDALLVVPALLVSGRPRPFLAWCAATLVLGLATVASLGPDGLAAYRAALGNASQWDTMRRFSLAGQAVWGAATPAVSLIVVAGTLALARKLRDELHLVMAVGLAGSLMLSPYLGLQDLCLLVPAIWLAWQGRVPPWHIAVSAVLYGVLELSLLIGPLPVLLAEVTWLGSVWFLRSGRVPGAPMPGTAPGLPRPAQRIAPQPRP